jgi:tripartite-type tricarboxylate transporter receptor subunit TctC
MAAMRKGRLTLGTAAAGMLAMLVASVALAADRFPAKPIRIVAAQQPGSATDNVARLVAEALEVQLGVPVTVDNRAGAGGKIGAEHAALAAADGYTLLVGGTSNLVLAAATDPDLRYDPTRDFVAIGRVAHVPFGYAVNADVPAKTLGDLVAMAKERPGKLTYASLGIGTSSGFGMELLRAETGVDMLAVEYKGIASAITDVLSGRVDAVYNEIAVLSQHAQSGRLRMLAIAEPRRVSRAPDVPTTAEAGFPGIVMSAWYGVLAPAATPPDVVKRLVEAYEAAVRTPAMRARIVALGYEPLSDMPGQFATALRDDIAKLKALASRTAKAKR